jgi:hypothetical protein
MTNDVKSLSRPLPFYGAVWDSSQFGEITVHRKVVVTLLFDTLSITYTIVL